MASKLPTRPIHERAQRRKTDRVRDGGYLAFLHELPCVVTASYVIEAAHISYADPRYGKSGRGLGFKEDDCWCIPLSPAEHRKQHDRGDERAYWSDVGIDPCRVALALYYCYRTDNRSAAILVIQHARDV